MKRTDIIINYGTDYKNMAIEVCKRAGLASMIGGTGKRIGIKPNIVNATTADQGATTHPELVAGVIEAILSSGHNDISIIEGAWVGEKTSKAFRVCGYHELRDKYQVKLIDTQKDSYKRYNCRGVEIQICDSAMDVDFMINMPVMKGHCQTTITCALKNNKGVIPNSEKRRFHSLGLDRPIAHLNVRAKSDFILVDGICGDLDFEEGGNPVQTDRILAFQDPVLCDAYISNLLGYAVTDVAYIGMAEKLGIGTADISKAYIMELNRGKKSSGPLKPTRKIEALAQHVNAKEACSACYGSLIHALDRLEKAGVKQEQKICIGQGFRGAAGKIGIGNCTEGFIHSLKGCPPKAIDMIDFLKNLL
jgi:uncharacterized protein (DUF362 family)